MANGPNKTVFAARSRKFAMVAEEIKKTEAEAQSVATEWRSNPEYKQVRVTSFKVGKRPDRTKGEKQAYNWAVRGYA
jgi:hypothetical protein